MVSKLNELNLQLISMIGEIELTTGTSLSMDFDNQTICNFDK